MTHRLEADSVLLEFGTRRVLSDIYLKCETGKITGLLGRNGQGKSCLMNVVYGSLDALSKSIRFDNTAVFQAFKRPDLLLYLPQFNFIPGSLTLRRIFSDFELEYAAFEQRFPDFKSRYKSAVKNLSGGQRRLVEVYLIVKAKSQFAMLDEPFSHLMPLQIEKVKDLLLEQRQAKGFLITDHLYRHILDVSDHLYVLSEGKTFLINDPSGIERLGYANPFR